jgi:excisionase family DNA binding protein
MGSRDPHLDDLLMPKEVAEMFGVQPKTVTNWAKAGKIETFTTPGGHRRYRRNDVEALLSEKRRER